jgi:hypothetical protein
LYSKGATASTTPSKSSVDFLAENSYFYRDKGTCSICGAFKKAIEAV